MNLALFCVVQLEAQEEAIANEFRDLLISKFDGESVETFIGNFKRNCSALNPGAARILIESSILLIIAIGEDSHNQNSRGAAK